MRTELQRQLDNLFTEDRLKRWVTEQHQYLQKELGDVQSVLDRAEEDILSLEMARDRLKQMFGASGRSRSIK